MTDDDAQFAEAVRSLRTRLKSEGFRAKGRTFFQRDGGNTMLISVQRSTASTPSNVSVTVNYGVRSGLLAARLNEDDGERALTDIWKAHWRKRITDEHAREAWIEVDWSFGNRLLSAVEGILPDLSSHSSDASLRDEWLEGRSPGLTKMQQLLYAAILVNEIGPPDKLQSVVDALRSLVEGTIHEGLVEARLRTSGVNA